MSTLPILKDNDPKLRIKSEPVNDDVSFIVEEMFKTLAAHPHGIALAAPQVGVHLRVFIMKKSYAKKMNISHTIIQSPFPRPKCQRARLCAQRASLSGGE